MQTALNSRETLDPENEDLEPPQSEDVTVAKRVPLDKVQKKNEKTAFFDTSLEPVLNPDGNPLKWWRVNAHKYLVLAHIARCVLAVLAMFAPSERFFSSSALVMTQRRNRLAGERIESLIVLKGPWLAAETMSKYQIV